MKQDLIDSCRYIFWGRPCYLDTANHTIFSDPQIKILGLDTAGMIVLPNYSMALIRKEYVESVKNRTDQTKHVYEQYHLNSPSYVFSLERSNAHLESEYIRKAHWFCEDCRLEDDFWDFFDSYTEPIIVAWLKDNQWFEEYL